MPTLALELTLTAIERRIHRRTATLTDRVTRSVIRHELAERQRPPTAARRREME